MSVSCLHLGLATYVIMRDASYSLWYPLSSFLYTVLRLRRDLLNYFRSNLLRIFSGLFAMSGYRNCSPLGGRKTWANWWSKTEYNSYKIICESGCNLRSTKTLGVHFAITLSWITQSQTSFRSPKILPLMPFFFKHELLNIQGTSDFRLKLICPMQTTMTFYFVSVRLSIRLSILFVFVFIPYLVQ